MSNVRSLVLKNHLKARLQHAQENIDMILDLNMADTMPGWALLDYVMVDRDNILSEFWAACFRARVKTHPDTDADAGRIGMNVEFCCDARSMLDGTDILDIKPYLICEFMYEPVRTLIPSFTAGNDQLETFFQTHLVKHGDDTWGPFLYMQKARKYLADHLIFRVQSYSADRLEVLAIDHKMPGTLKVIFDFTEHHLDLKAMESPE